MRAIFLGFSLVGLLVVVVIVTLLATDNLKGLGFGDSSNPTSSVDSANQVKAKADLNAISVKLNLYFSETRAYPNDLSEIDMYGLTQSDFVYTKCSSKKAIVSSSGQGIVLTSGSSSFGDDPSC